MTKDELWKVYCKRNPSFADPQAKIVMTGHGLKKLFDQTFDLGVKRGIDSASTVNDFLNKLRGAK